MRLSAVNWGAALLLCGGPLVMSCGSATSTGPNPDGDEVTLTAGTLEVTVAEDGEITFEVPVTVSPAGAGAPVISVASQPQHGEIVISGAQATYKPDADFNGADQVSFVGALDGHTSQAAVVTVVVSPVNDAPAANAGAVTTDEDQSATGTLGGSDIDGDSLGFAVATQPAHGTLVVDGATGAFTYSPSADYNGADSFTFTVSDGVTNSTSATIDVTVQAVNDAPTATGAAPATDEDTELVGALDGLDVDGDSLTFTVVTQPAHGVLVVDPETGDFSYDPDAEYSGTDGFEFLVNDGVVDSAAASVTITVKPVNDAPLAQAANYTLTEDGSFTGTLVASDAEGDTVTFAIAVQPAFGTLNLDPATGAFTYTPDADFFGLDSLRFLASDGLTDSEEASVGFEVEGVEDAPEAPDHAFTTQEDAAHGGLLPGYDVDQQPLSFTIVSGTTHGALALDDAATGAFTYTPDADYHGADSFTYRVDDGAQDSAVGTVTITVDPQNDPPAAGSLDIPNGVEDAAIAGTLPATDVDGDALTFSIRTAPQHGTITYLNVTTGAFTYSPQSNYNGEDSFEYEVSDPSGPAVSSVVTITIAPVNDAPIPDGGSTSTTLGTPVSFNVSATDPEGDAMTYSLVGLGIFGRAVLNDASAGAVTYTPDPCFSGTDRVSFKASDGALTSYAGSFSIVVTGAASQPSAVELTPAAGSIGTELVLRGCGFGAAADTVTVGGVAASVTVWTETEIRALVPSSLAAGSHDVVATVSGQSTAPLPFELSPFIGAIGPQAALPGGSITLSGRAFGASEGSATVGGVSAGVTSWSDTTITLQVPASLSGRVGVQVVTASGAPSNVSMLLVRGNDVWLFEDAPEGRDSHTAVWTGAEMLIFGGAGGLTYDRLAHGSRYDPVTDTWTPMSTAGQPSGRSGHTAVWTGSEMIVFGGVYPQTTPGAGQAGRYDPLTDSWALSTPSIYGARDYHTAVWTGTEMIVWGGMITGQNPTATAERYDPVADAWTPVTTVGAPSARQHPGAVWTGKAMAIWGGSGTQLGALYDPQTDTWQPMTTTGAPSARYPAAMKWTGREILIWGGYTTSSTTTNTGALYDPGTDTWRPITMTNAPGIRWDPANVWTGEELVVFGGYYYNYPSTSGFQGDGARYDPETDTWTPVSGVDAPSPRRRPAGVWTGKEMLVWGGLYYGTVNGTWVMRHLDDGARYNPSTDTWTPMGGNDDTPGTRTSHTAVWSGSEMLVFGGNDGAAAVAAGVRYDPATDTWTPMETTNEPSPRWAHASAWADGAMLVWGGYDGAAGLADGGIYDPAGDSWTAMPTTDAPSARWAHTATWTGSELIVFGGVNASGGAGLTDGAAFTPGSPGTWAALAAGGTAPSGRHSHSATWTGSEVVIWGGQSGSTYLADGALYEPGVGWSAMATAPLGARGQHGAVWSGAEVLIFGGRGSGWPEARADGARYDPASDTWTAMATNGAPSGRYAHAVAWTGAELLVWGGQSYNMYYVHDAARYDPAGDSWSAMSSTGEPAWRAGPTGVWTGEMFIVWGGYGDNNRRFGTMGRYLP